jgi:hypothetical protein
MRERGSINGSWHSTLIRFEKGAGRRAATDGGFALDLALPPRKEDQETIFA